MKYEVTEVTNHHPATIYSISSLNFEYADKKKQEIMDTVDILFNASFTLLQYFLFSMKLFLFFITEFYSWAWNTFNSLLAFYLLLD